MIALNDPLKLFSAGIANENGGITFIPVQVSVTGQSGTGLQPLTAQALTGTLNTQQLAATPPTSTAHNSPTAAKPNKKSPLQGTPPTRARRTGSLSLFFRKVWQFNCSLWKILVHLRNIFIKSKCCTYKLKLRLKRLYLTHTEKVQGIVLILMCTLIPHWNRLHQYNTAFHLLTFVYHWADILFYSYLYIFESDTLK